MSWLPSPTLPPPVAEHPAPAWLRGLPDRVRALSPDYFTRFAPPAGVEKQAAVLMLFGPSPRGGEDVLLTERSHDLRSHAGQVSFPGGRIDPDDAGPVAAALREAHEEVGVDPACVEILGELPGLYLGPSGNAVTPVLGWWAARHTPMIASHLEVARVVRARVADLVDPRHRFTVSTPIGYRGPGFEVERLFVWGFTAGLLEAILDIGEVALPWDHSRVRALPETMITPMMRDLFRRR
jgi:8-oxo-dGTP pyrophosphatase MutT (NUDIX family)